MAGISDKEHEEVVRKAREEERRKKEIEEREKRKKRLKRYDAEEEEDKEEIGEIRLAETNLDKCEDYSEPATEVKKPKSGGGILGFFGIGGDSR